MLAGRNVNVTASGAPNETHWRQFPFVAMTIASPLLQEGINDFLSVTIVSDLSQATDYPVLLFNHFIITAI